jgi:hypothetical protein
MPIGWIQVSEVAGRAQHRRDVASPQCGNQPAGDGVLGTTEQQEPVQAKLAVRQPPRASQPRRQAMANTATFNKAR